MNNFLISINNLLEIEKYQKVGFTTFLFALKDYSIGYRSFDINEINSVIGNNFVLINRLLDCHGVDELKLLMPQLLNTKGIIFEDLAVLSLLNDLNYKGLKIYFHNHAGTNYETINGWIELGIDSVMVSNEITYPEIEEITKKTNKPLILNIFGHNQVMYSRRQVLSNFQDYYQIEKEHFVNLKTNNHGFIAMETNYGTVFYTEEIYNYTSLLSLKALYYFVNLSLLSDEEVLKVLNDLKNKQFNFNYLLTSDGFLNDKTIFKLGVK